MTKTEVMQFLEEHGIPNTVKIFKRHGAKEPLFGNKIADLKILKKKIKIDQKLAEELWATKNSDAMYLACMIADPGLISRETLELWISQAYWYMLSEAAVAGVAAESPYALGLADKWINMDEKIKNAEMIQAGGWATYANYMSITPDSEIDKRLIERLLNRASAEVHHSMNRVRYCMNNFIIAAGSFIESMYDSAMEHAEAIGKVDVSMGETSCKVPLAADYLKNVKDKGRLGKKRKSAIC